MPMSTIPIEVSTEQLLQAVERLPASELDAFADRINALRTRRTAPRLRHDETALLLQINQATLDAQAQQRFHDLVAERQAEIITPDELHELMDLTDYSEQRAVVRLAALHDLAAIRGTTVPRLMETLGIPVPHDG
jgi:hypothetical protein